LKLIKQLDRKLVAGEGIEPLVPVCAVRDYEPDQRRFRKLFIGVCAVDYVAVVDGVVHKIKKQFEVNQTAES